MQVTPRKGAAAEAIAASYLARHGLRVLERNWRIRGGELDLVCQEGETLIFVEVRLRTRNDYGGAAESITLAKRRRLMLAARHYLAGKPEVPCRFDAVLLDDLDEDHLEWLKNAFS